MRSLFLVVASLLAATPAFANQPRQQFWYSYSYSYSSSWSSSWSYPGYGWTTGGYWSTTYTDTDTDTDTDSDSDTDSDTDTDTQTTETADTGKGGVECTGCDASAPGGAALTWLAAAGLVLRRRR